MERIDRLDCKTLRSSQPPKGCTAASSRDAVGPAAAVCPPGYSLSYFLVRCESCCQVCIVRLPIRFPVIWSGSSICQYRTKEYGPPYVRLALLMMCSRARNGQKERTIFNKESVRNLLGGSPIHPGGPWGAAMKGISLQLALLPSRIHGPWQ